MRSERCSKLISVLILSGTVATPMLKAFVEQTGSDFKIVTPIKRFAQPEEIGRLCAYLLSDESTYITGAIYSIDGGWTA